MDPRIRIHTKKCHGSATLLCTFMSFSLVLATASGLSCSPSSTAYSLTRTSLYCRIRELWNKEPKIRKRKKGVSEKERMSTITKRQKGLFLKAVLWIRIRNDLALCIQIRIRIGNADLNSDPGARKLNQN